MVSGKIDSCVVRRLFGSRLIPFKRTELLTKDVKNDKSEKGQPAKRMVDRRARRGGDYPDEKIAPQRPLSEEAFHETLGRYCRRFQKDGRDFCLASVTVHEYKHANDKERDQLDKAVVAVLFKQLRTEDRICFIQPAHYLILIPASQIDEANVAIRRVTEKISQSRIKQKNSQLQPSAFAKIVSARQKATQGAGDGMVDPETLYNSVGYTLNAKGKLLSLKADEEAHTEPLFRGNFEGWMERYSPAKASSGKNSGSTNKSAQPKTSGKETASHCVRLRDHWSGNSLVEMRELVVPNFASKKGATACSASSANLLRRLRILQNLDHPGINKLADFYASSEGKLLLINRVPNGIELTNGHLNGKKTSAIDVNATTLISWLQQILGALIAMQSLVPPVVPSTFDGIRVFYCDTDNKDGGQIVLSNFESDYLLSSAQVNSETGGHTAATGQQHLMDGIVHFILKLAQESRQTSDMKDLVSNLKKLDANSMSTPYKLRAYLKKFVEERNA